MINEVDRTDPALAEADSGRSRAALACGAVGLGALLVPPGLFISPVAAVAAVVLGWSGQDGSPRARRDAATAMVLGTVTLVAWCAIMVTFWDLILRVVGDINSGR